MESGQYPFCSQCKNRQCRVVQYIERHLSEKIELSDLADVAAMSLFHFARKFREAYGKPPMRMVAQMRVERVKRLLAHSDSPLSEIAIDAGYSSQSHMTSAFKGATGVTPKAFRQKSLPC